jgi:predicted component of type VI protein secretion system
MTLTLSVLRCPDAVPPETKRISGGELRIGRGPDNDWIMPDPERMLSKHHCVIAYRNGGWAIADTSTNGTFLNREPDPIGKGQIRELQDGDRLRFGAYEIEVRVAADEAYGASSGFGGGFGAPAGGFGGKAASPFDDPFASNPLAPPPPPPRDNFSAGAFGADPLLGGVPQAPGISLPDGFDPLAGGAGEFMGGATQADHTPSFSDAFRPPAARQVIPDDEDWGLSAPLTPPAPQGFAPAPVSQTFAAPPAYAPPPPQAFAPAPVPQAYAPAPPPPPAYAPPQAVPPGFGAPVPPETNPFGAPVQRDANPFGAPAPLPAPVQASPLADPGPSPFEEPSDRVPAPSPFAEAPVVAPVAAFAPAPESNPFAGDEPPRAVFAPPPVPAASPVAAAAVAAPVAADALLAAFLEGAGLPGTQPADPVAAMRALGAAFRATVTGIRQALIARTSIKGEFRIEQTMIRARGNNPLKFSADDDDALSALLGLGRRVDMGPAAAIDEALRDMRNHELATMAAMQGAVRALLGGLDPAPLLSSAEGGLLPAQKKARAFEAYEKLYDQVIRALADDFDSVFGKAFARAYETALRDISAREQP